MPQEFLTRHVDMDRKRCAAAHVPEDITCRPKWMIALEQLGRAPANGVRLGWLAFGEGYGSKPEFLSCGGKTRS